MSRVVHCKECGAFLGHEKTSHPETNRHCHGTHYPRSRVISHRCFGLVRMVRIEQPEIYNRKSYTKVRYAGMPQGGGLKKMIAKIWIATWKRLPDY